MVRITDKTLPVICFQSWGKSTEADFEILRPVYRRAFADTKPVLFVSDARYADHSAGQRRLWASWLEESTRTDVQRRGIGSVLMLDSALLRGALTALNWLTPPNVPQYVTGSEEEAVEKARGVAAANRLDVQPLIWGQVRLWLEEGQKHKR